MKKSILIALLCCLASSFAFAQNDWETVCLEKTYFSLGASSQFTTRINQIDLGGQLEFGWWFTPYTAVALNYGGGWVRGTAPRNPDPIFQGKKGDMYLRLLGIMDFTTIYLGVEDAARMDLHIAGYAGLGKITTSLSSIDSFAAAWSQPWMPSIGLDVYTRLRRHTKLYGRAGFNLYHPVHNLTLYPEISVGLRVGLGEGRVFYRDPNKIYKDNIAELEKELEKAKNNVKVQTDTVVVKETKEVEVEKLVRDTVVVTVNQVDTLTIYDVIETGTGVAAKADTVFVKADTVYVNNEPIVLRDTVFVKSAPEVLVKTVYADSVSATETDAAYIEPIVQVDTVYVLSEPEVRVQIQKDTVFVPSAPEVLIKKDTVFLASEPEIQIQIHKEVKTDTVFVAMEPEIMVRTVYVNKEPIVLRDTVFVATDPEVQIQTVYRDKEPVVLVDTVFVQSEPEIEIRYRDREVVKVQKDTVIVKETQEVEVEKLVEVEKIVRDTVIVEKDPIVQIQKDTIEIEKEPIVQIQKDTVVVKETQEVEVEKVVEVEKIVRDTVILEKGLIVQKDTIVIEKDPIVQIQKDTIVIEKDPIVQIQKDTVVVKETQEVEVEKVVEVEKIVRDTVVVEKDPVVQTDTVVVKVAVEPETTLIYVVFPENAAWVNYGSRKQLDRISKEIKEYTGSEKYLLIAPISPDSRDPVKAYNLGVRRVSQVRLHLIRENGVDSRKLREVVVNSPAGIPVEDGNAFVIVAREDDPRINEILGN